MLKIYRVNGRTYQFEEGKQPDGAEEVVKIKAVEPQNKAAKPANKTRRVKAK